MTPVLVFAATVQSEVTIGKSWLSQWKWTRKANFGSRTIPQLNLLLIDLLRIFSIIGPFDIYGNGAQDPLLRSRRELVVQIFRLVDYPENLQVSVAAMHAIMDMANSPVFAPTTPHSPHKLYSILEAAGELPAIMEAFVRRLEREETEQVAMLSESSHWNADLMNEDDGNAAAFGLTNLVRLQILDFLIAGIGKSGYNLAHYLLGFGPELLNGPASTILSISDAENGDDASSRKAPKTGTFTCFHLILELLAFGLGHPSSPIVTVEHPSLGQKCYQLIWMMMSNPLIGRATVNYLREREHFFEKQLLWFASEPIDLHDYGFTVFETMQRAHLLKGALLDIHFAFQEGAWSYAKKAASLLTGNPQRTKKADSDKESDENNVLGPLLIVKHFSIVDSLLSPDYAMGVHESCRALMEHAVIKLAQNASKLCQLLFFGLDRVPYDRLSIMEMQMRLASAIIPVVARLLSHPSTPAVIQESCSSLILSICAFMRRNNSSNKGTSLVGDELSSMVSISLMGIIRPDSSLVSRGYLYSALTEIHQLMQADGPAASGKSELEAFLAAIKKELGRILEIACGDLLVPASDATGWKTMAATFLAFVLNSHHSPKTETDVNSVSMAQSAMSILDRSGLLKSIIASLRLDDKEVSRLVHNIPTSTLNENVVYLWRSKLSLLQSLLFDAPSVDRLIEAGLMETLASLRILQLSPEQINLGRLSSVYHPIIRLLSLLASQGPSALSSTATLRRFVNGQPFFLNLLTSILSSSNKNEKQIGEDHGKLAKDLSVLVFMSASPTAANKENILDLIRLVMDQMANGSDNVAVSLKVIGSFLELNQESASLWFPQATSLRFFGTLLGTLSIIRDNGLQKDVALLNHVLDLALLMLNAIFKDAETRNHLMSASHQSSLQGIASQLDGFSQSASISPEVKTRLSSGILPLIKSKLKDDISSNF